MNNLEEVMRTATELDEHEDFYQGRDSTGLGTKIQLSYVYVP